MDEDYCFRCPCEPVIYASLAICETNPVSQVTDFVSSQLQNCLHPHPFARKNLEKCQDINFQCDFSALA
jgi:hypothetical protein